MINLNNTDVLCVAETFKAFLHMGNRDRYLSSLSSDDGRKTISRLLNHEFLADILMEYTVKCGNDADSVYSELKKLGAPEMCYVISSNDELNEKFVKLKDAIVKTLGFSMGTLVICKPGELGFYKSEENNEKYILYRKKYV